MNITVYLGSSTGHSAAVTGCTRELGAWIGRAGHTLVYGGAKVGQMGVLCDSVLENGGSVIGVIPDIPLILERMHPSLTEKIMTRDMAERRSRMIRLGNAFIALPGGIGTLDEITEVLCLKSLGELDAPCVLLGPEDFWKPFEALCDEMTCRGFIKNRIGEEILITGSVRDAAAFIENHYIRR